MSSESLAVNPSLDKVSGSTDSPTEDDCLGSDYLHSTEYKLATERFDGLILDYPKSIVNMLRDLHATRDIARFALTRSLSDFLRKKHNAKLSSPPRQVDAFYRTGMPALLADLVTQKENYVLEPDVEDIDFAEYEHAGTLIESLYHLVAFAEEGPDGFFRRHRNPIEAYVKKLPDLLGFILEVLAPTHILDEVDYDSEDESEEPADGDLRVTTILLSLRSSGLYSKIHGQVPPISTKLPHVMFRFWQDCVQSDMRSLCLGIVYQSLEIRNPNHDETSWRLLLPEIMVTEEDRSRVMQTIMEDFRDDDLPLPNTFLTLLLFMFLRDEYFPEYKDIVGNPKPWEIIDSLAAASQRAICFKNIDSTHTGTILSQGIKIVRGIVDAAVPGSEEARDIVDAVRYVQLITNLFPAIPKHDDSREDFDNMYAILRGYVRLSKHTNPVGPTLLHLAILKNYGWCLLSLQEANGNAKTRFSQEVLDAWIDIGAELDIILMLNQSNNAERILRPAPWRACHFGHCICNDMYPCHKMKVCKGCWSVRYCCALCQKRDWVEGGHREECRSATA